MTSDAVGKAIVQIDFKALDFDFKLHPNKKHYASWKASMQSYKSSILFWRTKMSIKNDFILFGSLLSNTRVPNIENLLMNQFEKMNLKFLLMNSSIDSDWVTRIYFKAVEGDIQSQLKFGLRFNQTMEGVSVDIFKTFLPVAFAQNNDLYLKIKQKDKSIIRTPVPTGHCNEIKFLTSLASTPISLNRFKFFFSNHQFYHRQFLRQAVGLEVYSKTMVSNYGVREFLSERGFPGDLSEAPTARNLALSQLLSLKLSYFPISFMSSNGMSQFFAVTFFARNFQFLCWELSLGLEKRLSHKLGCEFMFNVFKKNFQIRLISD